MFMDVVVFAGIATVLLMISFFVGVGIFVVKEHTAVTMISGVTSTFDIKLNHGIGKVQIAD